MSEEMNVDIVAETAAPPGRRSWVPATLIAVATVLAVLSAVTTWVRVQALDTDAWADASSELLQDPEVRSALATYLVDELYAGLDVADQLESSLPESVSGLAGTLAGALRGPAIDGVERVLERPRLHDVWVEANRRAHAALVAIVRDDTRDNVSTAGGAVVLDLGGAVRTVGEDLGLPAAALDRIPDDLGQVTVFESAELADVQDAVRVLDVLSWFLFLVVVALYALAVYLADGRRREMLRNVGLALIAGGVVLFALRSVGVRIAVESIVDTPSKRSLGGVVGEVFTQLLHSMALTAVVIGLLIAAYAALLGPHRWAAATRRSIRSTPNPALTISLGAVALVVVLAWWSPGLVFQRWITAITLLVAILAATIAMVAAVRTEHASSEVEG
jgi:multisubunit Na+/H+ antiporter MnhC subunit